MATEHCRENQEWSEDQWWFISTGMREVSGTNGM